jgi:poly(A) polymerase
MITSLHKRLSAIVSLTPKPVYLVGGTIRDLLTGNPDIKDIDILMPDGSEIVAREFANRNNGSFFFLDEERRISRVVIRDELTVQIDFTNFEGPDLQADLARRDFTVNAMAVDLREYLVSQSLDQVIDPFGGRVDAANKLIRVVHPAVLDQDPLRLLRAARFAATLGFTIEESTAQEIRRRAKLVRQPSAERVRDELFLILAERSAEQHFRLLDSLGLIAELLPELEPLRGFAPGRYHIHDVLTHAFKTAEYLDQAVDALAGASPHSAAVLAHLHEPLEQNVSRIAALRFACLLHDNAKPETFSNADNRIRFHNHDLLGAEKTKAICKRFRLSRETEKVVVGVIRHHMRLFNLATPGGPSRNAMQRYCRDLRDALPESLLLAQADARATSEIMPQEKFTDTTAVMAAVLDHYYSRYLKIEASPLVTGEDLIALGLQPGPRFREILEHIKEQQAEGKLKDRQEALDYLARSV